MSLTSQDETDLILPLFRGVEETPRFATFLARLRARTEAEHVGLVFRRPHAAPEEESEFFAGLDINRAMRESGLKEIYTTARAHHDRLRPGRVYSADEFQDLDPVYKLQRERSLHALGIRDERVVRISGEDGFNVLLVLARSKPCTAADSALLSNLAPYVAAASRNLVMLESQRIAAAMAAEGLGRSGVGWILFDPSARVLAVDSATRRALRQIAGIGVRLGQRIAHAQPQAERAIGEAASELAGNASAAPRSVVLHEDPRIEAVLSCANAVEVAGMVSSAMLALCRLPRPASEDRPARFARLFDLPPREAELAIALADGMSLAEAAEAMGLTIETARNYSKRLYGKLGVRGQAELVRRVYESSAVLA